MRARPPAPALPRGSARALLAAVLGLAAGGCPSLTAYTYPDAAGRWQRGDRQGALASARVVYDRFLRDNGVEAARVEALTRRAQAVLDETPVWDGAGVGPPGDARRAHRVDDAPDTLTRRLRADLLSGRLTPTLRAVAAVRALGLGGEARGLLAVIFRRPPLDGGEELLPGASRAERSLVAKRAALGALEGLAGGPAGGPAP